MEVLDRKIGADQAISFANNASVNTQVTIDIAKKTVENRCALEIFNPSTVTALTVKLFATALSLGGDTRYALIETVTIPAAATLTGTAVDTYFKLLEGLMIGDDLRIVISNNTALGASDAFIGRLRLRRV